MNRIIILLLLTGLSFCLFGQEEDYTWKNVPIGGGGYITGMKIHPLDATKRYYRTDVGGAYRWNEQSGRMEQLIFIDNSEFYSVAGIALHPTDTDILYLAVGRKCGPNRSAILFSNDGGLTMQELNIPGGIPFYFAANGGRNCNTSTDNNAPNTGDKDRQGTPLEINPHNPTELFIGSREKGLYILNVNNLNLTAVSSNQIPHNTTQYSIRSVVFHPTQPYVYIAYTNYGLFVGDLNAGTFYQADPANQFPQLKKAIDISISKNADYMLLACKTDGILKATLQNPASPQLEILSGYNTPQDEGYLTVDCSPHDNDVAVTVVADWNHINEFQVTTDAGDNWNQISGNVPNGNNIFPWRSGSFASHVAQITFSPSDPTELHYTSWFSTFQCNNFSVNGGNIWHNFESKGHEEIVPTEIVAFPKNTADYFLMVGSGDHTGFIFDDSIEDENAFATFDISDNAEPLNGLKKSGSMDFCENNPDNLIVCVPREWTDSDAGALKSDDGGLSWQLLSDYQLAYQKSLIAMSSTDPDNIIFLNNTHMMFTKDGGDNVDDASGSSTLSSDCTIPFSISCNGPSNLSGNNVNTSVFAAFRNITADKSLGCVFYYYDWDGTFNISTDGGENWCVMNDNTLPISNDPWEKTRLISIPDHPGHLWININKVLWHSTNGGRTWTNYTNVHSVNNVTALSFGKGLTNTYPALYIYGTVDGSNTRFVYRSDDAGLSWIKVNNHEQKELWGDIKMIAGDRNIAGRVYATVSGQGVVFGQAFTIESCDNVEKTIEGEFNQINSPSVPSWSAHEGGGATMNSFINQWTKAVLDISAPGTFNYDLQLWQDDLSMDVNKLYVIQTDLRADDTRFVTIKLRNKTNGTLYFEKDIEVLSDSKDMAFIFRSPVADNDLRLTLQVGGNSETVYVDHIRFREFCENDHDLLDCIDQLTLDEDLMHSDIFKVIEKIESAARISNTSQVVYQAGDNILLNPTFEVEQGVIFVADIKACVD